MGDVAALDGQGGVGDGLLLVKAPERDRLTRPSPLRVDVPLTHGRCTGRAA
jgi:hypothetical protein